MHRARLFAVNEFAAIENLSSAIRVGATERLYELMLNKEQKSFVHRHDTQLNLLAVLCLCDTNEIQKFTLADKASRTPTVAW